MWLRPPEISVTATQSRTDRLDTLKNRRDSALLPPLLSATLHAMDMAARPNGSVSAYFCSGGEPVVTSRTRSMKARAR